MIIFVALIVIAIQMAIITYLQVISEKNEQKLGTVKCRHHNFDRFYKSNRTIIVVTPTVQRIARLADLTRLFN